MVEAIRGAMDVSGLEPDVRNDARGEIRHQHLSAAKARERLGWEPTVPLREGLKQTIGYFEDLLRRLPPDALKR